MKRKISILSLLFFITSLVTPVSSISATEVSSISETEVTNENSEIIITEDIDNNKEQVIEDTLESDELTSNEEDDTNEKESTVNYVKEEQIPVLETEEIVSPNSLNEDEKLLNNKYNKNYINNLSSPKLYKSNETSEEINEFLNPKPVIHSYEVLDTKTNDKYEVALAYSDGSYYFVGSANTYEEAMQILENKQLTIAESNIIPVIINKNGQVIYSTNSMAYILNTSNATVNIYTTSSLSSAFTYVNQAYVSDIPLIESTNTAAKVQVSGYTGWIRNNFDDETLSDVRIVPMNQVKNPSYYISEEGILYHYISKDLTGTNGYKIAIGAAPSYLKENTRYFSYDGNYFYDGSNIETGLNAVVKDLREGNKNNSVNKNNPFYLYYQYLPLRTKTVYTADQLDKYIDAKTQSHSKLRGIGQALKDAEEKYGVNALLILGVAINESGWGTSSISQQKNNLFGIKAYDSNTGAADVFATPGDSVIEFAKNYMSKGYTNPSDWRHFGGLLGNKGVGANIKYASDPFWGEKAARYAFDVDLYLSNNKVNSLIDTNRYKIGMYTSNNVVKNSSGDTLYKVDNNHGWIGATFAFASNDVVNINGQSMYEIYPERNTSVSDTSYKGDYNWNSKGYINTSGIKIISDGSNTSPIGEQLVTYSTHVENIGWQGFVKNGEMSGTEGKALRLEAIKIKLENYPGASIRYSAHIQDIGWQDWKYNGEMAGTEGRALRLEAIKIEATGLPEGLEVQYRVHVENIGWQEWKSSGEIAGTSGQRLRIEGIQIRIGEKTPKISYKSHVQDIGWQDFVSDGKMSGTEGKALRLEGIIIDASDLPKGAYVRYRAHIQDIGWQEWKSSGEIAGTSGQAKRLEAIKIELVGAQGYHVEYRTHVENIGWQEWKRDGQTSGTEGKALRVEGIQIRIVKD